jgi:hypothetical protein
MLSWPFPAIKLTVGVGTLAVTGMLAELWGGRLPVWLTAAVAVFPFALFVLVRPGELPDRLGRAAHFVAAVWYLAVGAVVLVGYAVLKADSGRFPFWLAFFADGAVPCALVVWRAGPGRNDRPDAGLTQAGEHDDWGAI